VTRLYSNETKQIRKSDWVFNWRRESNDPVTLVSRLNIKTFFENFDNHLFAAVFVA